MFKISESQTILKRMYKRPAPVTYVNTSSEYPNNEINIVTSISNVQGKRNGQISLERVSSRRGVNVVFFDPDAISYNLNAGMVLYVADVDYDYDISKTKYQKLTQKNEPDACPCGFVGLGPIKYVNSYVYINMVTSGVVTLDDTVDLYINQHTKVDSKTPVGITVYIDKLMRCKLLVNTATCRRIIFGV